MSRNIISVLMSLLFLVLLAAPTVITIVDNSIDVSCFYASGEEEEKGSEKTEKSKEKDLLLFDFDYLDSGFTVSYHKNNSEYFFKKYSKPHLNLISPPPQQYI